MNVGVASDRGVRNSRNHVDDPENQGRITANPPESYKNHGESHKNHKNRNNVTLRKLLILHV